MRWKKKSIPKIKIINFVIRNNKIYEILFNGQELFLDEKKVWEKSEEKISSGVTCILKFLGTGPLDFRKRQKERRFDPFPKKKVKL